MKLTNRAIKFLGDTSGHFAVIASIMALPLLAGVGLAVDYAGLSNAKSRLQDANDAAALYAAVQYRQKGALPDEALVKGFLEQDFEKSGGEVDPVIARMQMIDGKLYLDSQVDKKMMLMGLFGHDLVTIPGSSVVNVGFDESLEISLALDTTYSMYSPSGSSSKELDPHGTYFKTPIASVTRLDALKFSATQFVNTVFENDGGKGRVRVSVVPFSLHVNVGTDKRGAAWLDVPDDSGPTGESCYKTKEYLGSENCRDITVVIDGVQVPSTQCDAIWGKEIDVCYPTGASVWSGCVGSRNEPLNVRDSSPSTKFKGLMNDSRCPSPIQALSGDKSETLKTISGLWANFGTYIPEGVMWGMRTLSSLEPYTNVKVPTDTKKVRKIMVLMTDGDNQAVADIPTTPVHREICEDSKQYCYSPNYTAEREKTDDWTLQACAQAKKSGIELYTISFGVDVSAKARSVVKSCATDAEHYFDAKDGDQLNKAFQAIAASIGGFYLAG